MTTARTPLSLRRDWRGVLKLLGLSLLAGLAAPLLFWINRTFNTDSGLDYTTSRRVRTSLHVPSLATLLLYGGAILMAVLAVVGVGAVVVAVVRGFFAGHCPACNAEVEVRRSAAEAPCPGCKRTLKVENASLVAEV